MKTHPTTYHAPGVHTQSDDVTKVVPSDAYVTDDVTVMSSGSARTSLVEAGRPVKPPSGMYETGHQTYMVLSVVVSVCFNLPMGLLAFFVSVKSSNSFQAGDIPGGRVRARCSLVISMLGIVVTVSIVMAVVFYIADKHRQLQYSYG